MAIFCDRSKDRVLSVSITSSSLTRSVASRWVTASSRTHSSRCSRMSGGSRLIVLGPAIGYSAIAGATPSTAMRPAASSRPRSVMRATGIGESLRVISTRPALWSRSA